MPKVKGKNEEEQQFKIVRVQRMFPNCEKYNKCCKESGYEETMKKVKKIHNMKELIEDVLEEAKKNGKTS